MDIVPPLNAGQPQPNQPPTPVPAAVPPPAPGGPRFPEDHFSLRSVLSTVGLLATALGIAILLNTFVIQSYQVDGQSMENTLQNNDRLIVDKIPRTLSRITGHQYIPQRGQIIIFNQTGLPGFVGEKQLIKRVIGLPGEHVVVNDGRITIYNAQHPNGVNPDVVTGYHIDAPTTIGNVDVQLQKDELFVCGDNRGNSEDSRYFGPIKTNQVVAKLILRILPLNKAKGF
jgi:signal peptidase I